METLLIRERYKVVRVLALQPSYALLEAVDISDRETPSCLLNLYEGELLHRYAKIYAGLSQTDCPAFRGMFLESGTLVTVFSRSTGEPIDRVFYRGDPWTWQDRLLYAGLLMQRVLALANFPPELSCAALLSDNVLVDPNSHTVELRWMLLPTEEMNQRETALMAADQLMKILPRTLRAGEAEQRFRDQLEAGEFRSVVALYGLWHEAEGAIRTEREEFERKGMLRRAGILLKRALKRGFKRGGRK